MRFTKWIFFGYLCFTAAVILVIAVSFAFAPERDADTLYGTFGDVKSLDPATINDVQSDGIASGIFECMYNYKYGGPRELLPELASDLPDFSPDGLTVTIHLKHGIRFYDPEKIVFPNGIGTEVKARDVVYSWKRVCNFHLASELYSGIFQGHIEGIDAWFNYTETVAEDKIDWERPIAGLQTPDEYTLVIKLTKPYAQLRYNLAHTPTAVVCRKAVDYWGDKIKDHPIGTGAYFLKEQLKEQRVVLEANPIYRGGPNVLEGTQLSDSDRMPHIKRVQLDFFAEELPVWLLFRQGQFDVGGIPKDSFSEAIAGGDLTPEMANDGIILTKSPSPSTGYFGFNMNDPVMGKNKPLRQAMSMAFDRDTFIKRFLNGRGVPAFGPIPPGLPTYDAGHVNPNAQFDVERAKAKVKEAEAIQGGPIPEMTLLMPGSATGSRQQADFFATCMEHVGLKIKVEYLNFARFQEVVNSRQAQIYSMGWVADYPDEQTFLQLFYGKNVGVNGINATLYQNPDFDALYEKAMVLNPGPERDVLYRRMCDLVMDDCPWLFSIHPVAFTLRHDWLENSKISEYGRNNRMYLTLDSKKRTAWLNHHK